jgi:Mn-dependent DtxR family transcriptional regulator/Fe2+ transport system protein FeoA
MTQVGSLSESLEDYLKIIFQLERDRRVARVKDIAARKGVRMASVTGALRRMAKEGLVHYGAREFVELTDDGAELARKVLQRHDFLRRFLTNTLGLPKETADKDADAIEHHLSAETLGRLVALYQFLATYGHSHLLSQFLEDGLSVPCSHCPNADPVLRPATKSLHDLEPGSWGRVTWVDGDAKHRLDLVEKGVMPRVRMEMEAKHGGLVKVRIKGTPVQLTEDQARAILVQPISREEGLRALHPDGSVC